MIACSDSVQPLISVIVPVYNTEQYLHKCLDSIMNQTYKNLEIICVNDGSTDSSGKILDDYKAKDSRFVIIHKQNAGQAAARNDALNIATGEYIANLDSDDYLEFHAYEKAMSYFTPEIDMVWFGCHIVCDYDQSLKQKLEKFYNVPFEGKRFCSVQNVGTLSSAVWNKIVRRSIVERYQIRYPEGVVFEDICFFAQLLGVTKHIYFTQEKLLYYLQRQTSTMGAARKRNSQLSLDSLRIIEPLYRFYKRWGLFKWRKEMYARFFGKFYYTAISFLPESEVYAASVKAMEMVQKFELIKLVPNAPVIKGIVKRIQGKKIREKKFTLLGMRIYRKIYAWGETRTKLLGFSICVKTGYPVHDTIKTPFYKKTPTRTTFRLFGIPLWSIVKKNKKHQYKLFGVPVLTLRGSDLSKAKPAVTPKTSAPQPSKKAATAQVHANVAILGLNELLKGRSALVTGGTSGIGFAIAQSFLNSGSSVIITGRSDEKIQKAVSELKKLTGCTNVQGIVLDNSDIKNLAPMFNKILDATEKHQIDILVNNAGVMGGHLAGCSEEQYDKVMNTNLKGTVFLTRIVAQHMKSKKIAGNILNIASASSLRPANSAYILSKWGIRALTQGLAKSLIPYGITVNGIAPGPTATPMLGKTASDDLSLPKNPLGRYALPEEIASMAVILTSNMGRTIVGDIIYMTGGGALLTLDDVQCTF